MAGHDWRHGWIPLTMTAALAKAHGSRRGARNALGSGRSRTAAQRKVSKSTGTAHRAIAPGLSKSYTAGRGATQQDLQTLMARHIAMHGKPPTARQVAKIKRAR